MPELLVTAATHIGKPEFGTNQDALLCERACWSDTTFPSLYRQRIESDRCCFGVADGLAIHPRSQIVSRKILLWLKELCDRTLPTAKEIASFQSRLETLALQKPSLRGAAATLAAAAFGNETLRLFWAGDSRIYRFEAL
jgi:serine/threonine protein phosphatase PrpC